MIPEYQAALLLDTTASMMDPFHVNILRRMMDSIWILDEVGIAGNRPTPLYTDVTLAEAASLWDESSLLLDPDSMASLAEIMGTWFLFAGGVPWQKRAMASASVGQTPAQGNASADEAAGTGWLLPVLVLGIGFFLYKKGKI